MKRQAMEWLSQVYPELSTEYEEVESLAELLRSVVARAVEEERMACARAVCNLCTGDLDLNLPSCSTKVNGSTNGRAEQGIHLHTILNQLNVDKRECKHCDKSQQDHEWVGGYCGGGEHKKFEAKA